MEPKRIRESVGPLSTILVSPEGKMKDVQEAVVLPSKVVELLQTPNVAVIRVIVEGWSINGNYYDTESLKNLVALLEIQGHIQFKNHLEEDDKTHLDREWEELVSYTKFAWHDEATKAVYAAVKFPKEKADTGWIYNIIKEDPEIVGVSISAAVYVTENFKKEGKTGTKIDGWAFFDSADYVLWPSAGGVAVAASEVQEKIKRAKEAKKLAITPKQTLKEKLVAEKEKFELVAESVSSFVSILNDKKAWYEVQAVIYALQQYLEDCWYWVYADAQDGVTPEQRLKAIEDAFEKAKAAITNLELWKNPNFLEETFTAQESTKLNKESYAMNLAELKEKDPQAYAQLQKEAVALVAAEFNEAHAKELSTAKEAVTVLTTENSKLKASVDTYELKEKVAAFKQQVATAIAESKIEAKYVTPTFMNVLESQDSIEKVKELIEDRKSVMAEPAPAGTTVHKEKTAEATADAPKMEDILKGVAREAIKH